MNDIGKHVDGDNVVLKLDMAAKVYDRVSWTYLCYMLRKMGFSERWIEIIHRYIRDRKSVV